MVCEWVFIHIKKTSMGIVGIANPHYDFVIPVFLTPLGIDGGLAK